MTAMVDDVDRRIDLEDGPVAVARAALAAASRHKVKLTLWILLCVAAAATQAYLTTPLFTATATLLLEPRRQANSAGQDSSSLPILDTPRAESELQVIKSERLLITVFDGLKLSDSKEFSSLGENGSSILSGFINRNIYANDKRVESDNVIKMLAFTKFSDRVNVRRVGLSYVIEVSFTSTDPILSRRIANSIISAYLWQSVSFKADTARNGGEYIQGRLNALAAQAKAAWAGIEAGELPASPTPDADARVIGAALQPLKKSAPRTGLIIALGGTLGLMSGFLALAISSVVDRKIYGADTLVQDFKLNTLAVLPELKWRGGQSASPLLMRSFGSLSETDREYIASLNYLMNSIDLSNDAIRDKGITVAFLPCGFGVNSSILCLNFAHMLRQNGRKVALIDANPLLERGGLTEAIKRDLDKRQYQDSARHDTQNTDFIEVDGLIFLPNTSQKIDQHNSDFLLGRKLEAAVSKTRGRYDVIIDLPSINSIADSRLGCALADVVLIVVAAGRTTRDDVAHASRSLRGVKANVRGAVLNRSRS